MNLKMIATDMDGTFLTDDKKYNVDRFREQLKFMEKKGIRFVAASGNQYQHLYDIFAPVNDQFQIDFVADNGARIFTGADLLYESPVSSEQLRRIIEWNAQNPGSLDNLIILSGAESAYVSNHATPTTLAEVSTFYAPIKQVEKLLEVPDNVFKVTFVWPDMAVEKYVIQLRNIFGEELHATGSGFGSVDLLAKEVNKAHGISRLQREYGIETADIVAFGDNDNDLEMLNYVDQGYLMPNAYKWMREQINLRALNDNNHEGVLDTIEQLLGEV
ncbi:HAD family hydrolase [Periweissella cryptocerci]|uniref:HAD family hydrolase n=1 Tax=Periweissella cryptocerci TaxID=2506420 RepID=A0A4P6YV82_9LACO|nr:Cof-type HAD-IIB family hydrolase [Periweissella cryptocerci]QBO36661.1 HAD family hydrolase [Periweissella cryptocerci]